MIVFTALKSSSGSSCLPADFVRSCRKISLSKIALNSSASIPKEMWIKNSKEDLYQQLHLTLSSLSPQTLAKCETSSELIRPLLFNLALLHTVIIIATASKATKTFEYSHICLFADCVEQLLLLTGHAPRSRTDSSFILKAIRVHVHQVYACCLPQQELEELVETLLCEEAAKPSTRIKVPGCDVELTLPSQTVTPKSFSDHVQGLMDAIGHESSDQLLRCVHIMFKLICFGINTEHLGNYGGRGRDLFELKAAHILRMPVLSYYIGNHLISLKDYAQKEHVPTSPARPSPLPQAKIHRQGPDTEFLVEVCLATCSDNTTTMHVPHSFLLVDLVTLLKVSSLFLCHS